LQPIWGIGEAVIQLQPICQIGQAVIHAALQPRRRRDRIAPATPDLKPQQAGRIVTC
jgi:hypothetical protein